MSTAKDYIRFFFQAASRPLKIGAIAPSSRHLAERMLEKLDPSSSKLVVEVGPGTGAITRVVLERLKDKSQYVGLDINQIFIEGLRERFPNVRFIHDSVENLEEYLPQGALADYVVCSLPWTVLPPKIQAELLHKIHERLKPGGWFCTYSYLLSANTPPAVRFRELLEKSFGQVNKSQPVWINFPPAMVYQCVK